MKLGFWKALFLMYAAYVALRMYETNKSPISLMLEHFGEVRSFITSKFSKDEQSTS